MTSSPERRLLPEPIPEILEAAQDLDDAVTAHLAGDRTLAAALFRRAKHPQVWEWTDSVWGKKSRFVFVTKIPIEGRQDEGPGKNADVSPKEIAARTRRIPLPVLRTSP